MTRARLGPKSAFLVASLLSAGARGDDPSPGGGTLEKVDLPAATVADEGKTPSAAIDSQGGIYVVFFDEKTRDILLSTSSDGGKTFSRPVKALNTGGRGHAGAQRGPRVAVDALKGVYVSACFKLEAGDEESSGSDVCLAVSRDSGKSFGKVIRVNDVPRSAPEMYHALAVTPSGEAHLAWLDLRRRPEVGQMIYSAKVTRGPQGELRAGRNVEVYVSPGEKRTVCECCGLGIAVDGRGDLAIAFRNSLSDGSRDTFLTISQSGGASFQPAARVGRGSWKTPG